VEGLIAQKGCHGSKIPSRSPFVFRFFADLAGVEGPWVPRPFCLCLFLPDPSSSRSIVLSLILSTLPSLLVFLVGFSSFSFRLAPAEEAAGIVPLSSQFQRDGSYIPSGLSGREPWPYARKISLFPIFFFLHGLEFIGVE
jgi:hypothetical protein